MCRGWILAGNHQTRARWKLCEDEFGGDWQLLKKDPRYGHLYYTTCRICLNLTNEEALLVRVSLFRLCTA